MNDDVVDILIGLLALGGAALFVLAGVGILRFPDLYTRMHAATKATSLGVVVIAAMAFIGLDVGRGKVALAAIFILVTAPGSAHFIGRIAHRDEGVPQHFDGPDDLGAAIDRDQ